MRTIKVLFSALVLLVTVDNIAYGQQKVANRHRLPIIDTHVHLDTQVGRDTFDFVGAANAAIKQMDKLGNQTMILMPTPRPKERSYPDILDEALTVAKKHPGRFAVMAGGWSLNGMIHSTPPHAVDASIRRKFSEKAEEIVAAGAVGFGELAALHFSFNADHPFGAAPPDHPLFLLLADIAAKHDVPIDLHMDAVAQDMPAPPELLSRSNANPATVDGNISALERLLAHNRGAKIVWTHLGWDNTGQRTVRLTRRLLNAHPNLYLAVKVKGNSLSKKTRLLKKGVGLRPSWKKLISDFPSRFVVGSVHFSPAPGFKRKRPPGLTGVVRFLNFLPRGLAEKIAVHNPAQIYRMNSAAP